MSFKSAKKKLTREEIVEILKRNAELYKNEPDFVNYIIDLAMFLLEQQYGGNAADNTRPKNEMIISTYSPLEMYKIYHDKETTMQFCRVCGKEVLTGTNCESCGTLC